MEIEFTDRYGGNPPSYFRGCFGPCEAMGYYPEPPNGNYDADIDQWQFVKCPECNGTGRVSLFRGLLRIPRWLWKGTIFVWRVNRDCPGPATMTKWQNTVLGFKCAFLADLGLWRP